MCNTMKFLANDNMVKITCIDTTELVQKAQKIHNLSKTVMVAFGRLLTMGAIMGADLKQEMDNITLQIKSNGKAGTITCVAKRGAKVKGFIENPKVEDVLDENNCLKISEVVGTSGKIYIIKDLGLKQPYIGIGDIVSGDITNDFVNYYATSEQIPTILTLGVCFEENGVVKKAGGYFLQLMPEATEEVVSRLEKISLNIPSITDMLLTEMSLTNIAIKVTGDENLLTMLGEIQNKYICDCSKERIEKGLISLGKDEIEDIIKENKDIEINCQFCKKSYVFTVEDLQKLL